MIIRDMCLECGDAQVIEIPDESYTKWASGTLLQIAAPMLSPGKREFLITRLCEKCFDSICAEMEAE